MIPPPREDAAEALQVPTEKCLWEPKVGWPRWPGTSLVPRPDGLGAGVDSPQVEELLNRGCLPEESRRAEPAHGALTMWQPGGE